MPDMTAASQRRPTPQESIGRIKNHIATRRMQIAEELKKLDERERAVNKWAEEVANAK